MIRHFLHVHVAGMASISGCLRADALDIEGDGDLARVIVLGVGMRSHTGVARRMFGALAERGINIRMINTSEVRLSVVVDRARGEEALTCLKDAFNL